MNAPVAIHTLKPWKVWDEPASWPASAGLLFIVAAGVRVADAKFGIDAEDIAHDPDTEGYRNEIASSLSAQIRDGSLVASAQPTGGGRVAAIAPAEWTPDTAFEAVRTGLILRPHGRSKRHPHWVFVGRRETEVLERVYRATDMLFPPQDRGPAEDLGDLVLAALSAIARNPAAIGPAEAVTTLLLPQSDWAPHPDDRETVKAKTEEWLLRRMKADVARELRKDDLRRYAVEAFPRFVTKRSFDDAWSGARKRLEDELALQRQLLRDKKTRDPAALLVPGIESRDAAALMAYFTGGRRPKTK